MQLEQQLEWRSRMLVQSPSKHRKHLHTPHRKSSVFYVLVAQIYSVAILAMKIMEM